MEIFTVILLAVLWLGFVLLSRIMTTTIHELGHAIPALWLTDKEVIIHVGSYRNEENSFLINLGRLKAYFKFNVTQLNMGLCKHHPVANIKAKMLITLGGPLGSLLLALSLILIVVNSNFQEGITALFVLFILSALWDFVINLLPSAQPILLDSSQFCYNDGQQFLELWQERKYPAVYFNGLEHQYQAEHALAIVAFQTALQSQQYPPIYRALATSQIAMKEYEAALETYENLHDKFGLSGVDYAKVGDVYAEKKEYQEAIEAYNYAIYQDYQNHHVLYGRGRVYQEVVEHDAAIQDFDAAIHYARQNYNIVLPKVYTYRGWSKIKRNDMEGAKTDLEYAKALDPNDPYVYLHFGFYYQKQHQNQLALENFQKAKELKIDHYGIDYYIHDVE